MKRPTMIFHFDRAKLNATLGRQIEADQCRISDASDSLMRAHRRYQCAIGRRQGETLFPDTH